MQLIILASKSPRRKELLKKIIKNFRVVDSGVDEEKIKAPTPLLFAKKAALAKARAVAKKHQKAIVIGADTIVVLGNKILGKPRDEEHAIAMLESLSGRVQKVITGLAVIFPGGRTVVAAETTRVRMKKVSEDKIINYVHTHRPLDKAGAYGIQELDDVFIESIEGDYDNVVGLPVSKLKKIMIQSPASSKWFSQR